MLKLFICFLLLSFSYCNIINYYISNNGTDSSSCGSEETPCMSINIGIENACFNQSINSNNSIIIWVYSGNYYTSNIQLNCSLELHSLNGSNNTNIIFNNNNGIINHNNNSKHSYIIEGFSISLGFIEISNIDSLILNDIIFNNQSLYNVININNIQSIFLSNITINDSYQIDTLLSLYNINNITISNIYISNSTVNNGFYIESFDSLNISNVTCISLHNITHVLSIISNNEDSSINMDNLYLSSIHAIRRGLLMINIDSFNVIVNSIYIYDIFGFFTILRCNGNLELYNADIEFIRDVDNIIEVNSQNLISVYLYNCTFNNTLASISGITTSSNTNITLSNLTTTSVVSDKFINIIPGILDTTYNFVMEYSNILSCSFNSFLYMRNQQGSLSISNSTFDNNDTPPPGFGSISEEYFIFLEIGHKTPVFITSCNFTNNNIPLVYIATVIQVELSYINFINNSGTGDDMIHILNSIVDTSYLAFINNTNFSFQVSTSNITLSNLLMNNNCEEYNLLLITMSTIIAENWRILSNYVTSSVGTIVRIQQSSYNGSNVEFTNNTGVIAAGLTFSENCVIFISESNFENNLANYGSAIYLIDSTIVLKNSNLINNNAVFDGGAVWSSGLSFGEFTNCNITGNIANNNGGGLYFEGNSTYIVNSINFKQNKALSGGCVYITEYSNITVSLSTFVNCKANTGGGAVVIASFSTPTFNSCSFTECIANSVGSVANIIGYSKPNFIDCNITDNTTPNEGALYFEDTSNSTLTNILFHNNYAGSIGGAMVLTINSTALITHCNFTNNTSGSKGGAVAVKSRGTPRFTDCLFQLNSADSGGAAYSTDLSYIDFTSCIFSNNYAQSKGGAIEISSKALLLLHTCSVISNIAARGPGGGMVIEDSSTATITISNFDNNTATYGGAFYAVSNGYLIADTCSFINNTASYSGGAVHVGENSIVEWINCKCIGNTAVGSAGGCILANDNSTALLFVVVFDYNFAQFGGGIATLGISRVNTSFCTFKNNIAASGAGVEVSEKSTYTDISSMFEFNYAQSYGGGCTLSGSDIYFIGTQFLNNSATSGGAILLSYGNSSNPIFIDCIFSYNDAITGGALFLSYYSSAYLDYGNSDIIYDYDNTITYNITNYSFYNCSFNSNSANDGGAVYIDSSLNVTPKFLSCNFTYNIAYNFGGTLFFGVYADPYIIMENTTFIGNIAEYGGCIASYIVIVNTSQALDFCNNCDFDLDLSVGYQTDNGFAGPPIRLGFVSFDSCPNSVEIDSSPITIDVYIFDDFGTIVTGNFITDNKVTISLHTLSNSTYLSTTNTTVYSNSTSGAATFTNVSICGPNNSTTGLEFSTFVPTYVIADEICAILLNGCQSGYKASQEDENPCAICVKDKEEGPWFIAGIFGLICIILLCILCVLLSTFFGWRYWKIQKIKKLQSIEIPDFTGKPSPTLEDILSDPSIPRIPWNEITIKETIGKGASGLVSSAIWKSSKSTSDIALKELIFGFQDFGPEVLDEFLIEIKYMSALVHKNIVQFLGICIPDDNSKLYLVTELMHRGSVKGIIEKKGENIPWNLRIQLAKDAAKGMSYLHNKKLIHRDLKTDNLLVNDQWKCKVADFGISTVKPTITREMTCIGTPVYMAPEVLSKNKYSEKADVYSFGIVLYELFSGNRAYSTDEYATLNQAQLMYQIIENHARPPLNGFHPSLEQLINDCWNLDPRLRPTFGESIVRLRRLKNEESKHKVIIAKAIRSNSQSTGDINFSLTDSLSSINYDSKDHEIIDDNNDFNNDDNDDNDDIKPLLKNSI